MESYRELPISIEKAYKNIIKERQNSYVDYGMVDKK